MTFRCSVASRADGEPIAGTAPQEAAFLFVEYAGAWGRDAVAEARWPEEIRTFLDIEGVRVQLIRRHGGATGAHIRVFTALVRPDRIHLETTLLDDVADVLRLDVTALAEGRSPGLAPYDGLLWLVCTNGRRDICCAEVGRPVTAALAGVWPEQTWETTHLGGHRFSGTLLALPSGITLGRLDAESAVLACRELADGRHPIGFSRGRVGASGAAQVAQLRVCEESGLDELDAVRVRDVHGEKVTVQAGDQRYRVGVRTDRGEPRSQSCGDGPAKPASVFTVTGVAAS